MFNPFEWVLASYYKVLDYIQIEAIVIHMN